MPSTHKGQLFFGFAMAMSIASLWAFWVVLSRLGVTKTTLTPFDIVALRYTTATIFLLPFIHKYYPRNQPFYRIVILSFVAAGIPYSLSGFFAFRHVSVAQSSVIMNGTMGLSSLLFIVLWLRESVSLLKIIGVATSLLGCVLINLDKIMIDGGFAYLLSLNYPHLLLIIMSLIMGYYGVAYRHWGFKWQELLVIAAPIQSIAATIVWLFFYESSGLLTASLHEIALQALFQGLGPSVLGVVSYALAVQYFGRIPTSAIMAGVPGLAMLLGIFILGEYPNFYEILGFFIVMVGVLLTIDWVKKS